VGYLHGQYVYQRRVTVLVEHLAGVIPPNATVLDVGCGDGLLARRLIHRRADLQITGIDVKVRAGTHIHVDPFDGSHIPWADESFAVVMFVDTLHHTNDPEVLLREAKRVSQQAIVIKDHLRDGWLAYPCLRCMDWVGNARHGVSLPYNYWTRNQWFDAFMTLNLRVEVWKAKLHLNPPLLGWLFDRSLHFISLLRCR